MDGTLILKYRRASIAGLHGLHPKQLARIGLFYLEEAV